MSKRKVRMKAYNLIVKEGRSHQEAYDDLKDNISIPLDLVVEEIA